MKKPTQYHFKRVLGYGASGTVYEAALRDKPDCTAAIKCIQFRGDTRLRKIAKEEAELHVKLQHPCVLQFLGVDETSEECYIALELCTRGSLHSFLFTNAHAKSFSKDSICTQICAAVHYLHEGAFPDMSVIHRDIKVENILMSNDMKVKLADFGAALVKPKGKIGRWGIAGTPGYMSPEMLLNQAYGVATDTWSLGLVLYEIWSGSLCPSGSSERNDIDRMINVLPAEEKTIVGKFLCQTPSDRATVGWALSMPKMIAALMSFSSVPPALVSQFRWSTSDSGHATQFNTALNSNTSGMGKYKDMPPFRFL